MKPLGSFLVTSFLDLAAAVLWTKRTDYNNFDEPLMVRSPVTLVDDSVAMVSELTGIPVEDLELIDDLKNTIRLGVNKTNTLFKSRH